MADVVTWAALGTALASIGAQVGLLLRIGADLDAGRSAKLRVNELSKEFSEYREEIASKISRVQTLAEANIVTLSQSDNRLLQTEQRLVKAQDKLTADFGAMSRDVSENFRRMHARLDRVLMEARVADEGQ